MMQSPTIIVKCTGCKNELDIADTSCDNFGNITLEVKPCINLGCHDCSGCEESEELVKLKKTLKELSAVGATT